jgi:hypothetical protein
MQDANPSVFFITTQVEGQSYQKLIKNNFRAKSQRKNEQYNYGRKADIYESRRKRFACSLRRNGL